MSLPVIVVKPVYHKQQHCVGLFFKYDFALKNIIKAAGYEWSGSKTMWFRPFAEGVLEDLKQLVVDKAALDLSAMESDDNPFKTGSDKVLPLDQKRALTTYYHSLLDAKQNKWIEDFRKRLHASRYSAKTIRPYCDVMRTLLGFVGWKNRDDIKSEDIWCFAADYLNRHGYSDVYHRQFKSALKLFLQTNEVDLDVDELIKMPKRGKKLAKVLGVDEVFEMIRKTANMKHRVMLSMLYGCGLRIGELLALQVQDIRLDRGMVEIHRGKGHKDRVVGLNGFLKQLVINYLATYEPQHYFIPGKNGAYSASAAQSVVRQAAKRAGLKMRVHPHVLRHSFATHLLEDGVDLRYLQDLLGHASPETTMGYTFVARRKLTEIESPFDRMLRKQNRKNGDDNNFLTDGNPG